MRKFFYTKVYLNKEGSKWCKVKVFYCKNDMQQYYYDHNENDDNHFFTEGVHRAYHLIRFKEDGSEEASGETGEVLLHWDQCGGGLVSHEFGHAVLWAYKHAADKQQYPIVINSMEDEEEILHGLYRAVSSFYNWLYKYVQPEYQKIDSIATHPAKI